MVIRSLWSVNDAFIPVICPLIVATDAVSPAVVPINPRSVTPLAVIHVVLASACDFNESYALLVQ